MIQPRTKSPVMPPRSGPTGDVGTGIALMVAAMALLPVGDTLSKLLTQAIPAAEVTMWRLLFQTGVMVPLALVLRRRLRGAFASPILALSGFFVVMSLTSLITAFAVMPIATAITIFFVEPLLLVLLAGPLLGEKVGPRRYAAVGVGFIGALLVIRPGFEGFTPVALLPLLAALGYALNVVTIRFAAQSRSSLTIQAGATVYAAMISSAVVLGLWSFDLLSFAAPVAPGWVWGILPLAGVVSAVSFLLIAEAFRRSEAGLLAPFQYLEIVGATVLGFVVFNDLPDLMTVFGASIILGSGAYIVHRERVTAGAGRTQPTEVVEPAPAPQP